MVNPYPVVPRPQAGLVGLVKAAGALVVVAVVVNVANGVPVDVPAQYPVP